MYNAINQANDIRITRMQEAQQHRLVREASVYTKMHTPRRRAIVKVVMLSITRAISIVTGA